MKKRKQRHVVSTMLPPSDRPAGAFRSASDASWRRSLLGYGERFVNDFEYGGIRVRQFASRVAFEKAMKREKFSMNILCLDNASANDYDRVPDTAFTVWDASILLGMYASREDVWNRLVFSAAADDDESSTSDSIQPPPIVTLELGAGAGMATLLVAKSSAVQGQRRCIMAMTDLPGTINFTKVNALSNLEVINENVSIVTSTIRWGTEEDVMLLPIELRKPHIIFGADLLYTCDETVIQALVQTVAILVQPGCVAVFAVCREHRPESIECFVNLVEEEGFDINRIHASSAHPDLDACDDDFEIIECWRRNQ